MEEEKLMMEDEKKKYSLIGILAFVFSLLALLGLLLTMILSEANSEIGAVLMVSMSPAALILGIVDLCQHNQKRGLTITAIVIGSIILALVIAVIASTDDDTDTDADAVVDTSEYEDDEAEDTSDDMISEPDVEGASEMIESMYDDAESNRTAECEYNEEDDSMYVKVTLDNDLSALRKISLPTDYIVAFMDKDTLEGAIYTQASKADEIKTDLIDDYDFDDDLSVTIAVREYDSSASDYLNQPAILFAVYSDQNYFVNGYGAEYELTDSGVQEYINFYKDLLQNYY